MLPEISSTGHWALIALVAAGQLAWPLLGFYLVRKARPEDIPKVADALARWRGLFRRR